MELKEWTFTDWHFSDDEALDALVRTRVREAFSQTLAEGGLGIFISAWWAGTSWRVMLDLDGSGFMPNLDITLSEMVDEVEGWVGGEPETAIAIAEEMEKQAARLRAMVAAATTA